MKTLRIVLAVAEWVFAASSLFGTDYSWPTTDYGSLVATDYSWGESERESVVSDTADAASTPHAEVLRILKWFRLTPRATLVEFGCGHDARFCVAASSAYGCKSIGIEVDAGRAESARRRVEGLGLQDLVTIIHGDATEVDVEADYGVAYLWPDTLAGIRQKILELTAFASFSHEVPGLPMTRSSDSFFWNSAFHGNQEPEESANPVGVWNGVAYTGRVCSNPGCTMCAAIESQIASQLSKPKPNAKEKIDGVNGRYVSVKYCNGRQCWYQNEWRWF